ncbi:hypothetical protein VIB_000505 [Vibrio metschnikovii CIP 69.14]|nr:hypothetical protein VIB_000505 [Vibrio metschnikovii CIP 69.14]
MPVIADPVAEDADSKNLIVPVGAVVADQDNGRPPIAWPKRLRRQDS